MGAVGEEVGAGRAEGVWGMGGQRGWEEGRAEGMGRCKGQCRGVRVKRARDEIREREGCCTGAWLLL